MASVHAVARTDDWPASFPFHLDLQGAAYIACLVLRPAALDASAVLDAVHCSAAHFPASFRERGRDCPSVMAWMAHWDALLKLMPLAAPLAWLPAEVLGVTHWVPH